MLFLLRLGLFRSSAHSAGALRCSPAATVEEGGEGGLELCCLHPVGGCRHGFRAPSAPQGRVGGGGGAAGAEQFSLAGCQAGVVVSFNLYVLSQSHIVKVACLY